MTLLTPAVQEPLTSLDSHTGLLVLRALKAAALRGTCVLAVLHQPGMRVWRQIDDCIVITTAGRVAYSGPALKAADYFEQNVRQRRPDETDIPSAEFVIDSVAENNVLNFEPEVVLDESDEAATRASLEAACALIADRVSWWVQFTLFAKRCSIEFWRHTDDLLYDFLLQATAGALIGALFPRYGLRDAQQVMLRPVPSYADLGPRSRSSCN